MYYNIEGKRLAWEYERKFEECKCDKEENTRLNSVNSRS